MTAESPNNEATHAERARGSQRKKPSMRLPPDSPYDWPKNFSELVEWYAHEVEDITRASQLRIKEATAFVAACTDREISLEEARRKWGEYDNKWGSIFPGGLDRTRNASDEEINKAIDELKNRSSGGRG